MDQGSFCLPTIPPVLSLSPWNKKGQGHCLFSRKQEGGKSQCPGQATFDHIPLAQTQSQR